ncbi:MAG: hypothetical protein KDA92_07760 [Planctomycetales bacterium]|nr:hypothetical protein [Planctomycetales bacterium]
MRIIRYLWASPYTALGCLVGAAALATGGSGKLVDGVWEFHGGAAVRFLNRLPLPNVAAITLGHSVIGRTAQALEDTRSHERVHVRQFERWGFFMGPAYLGCSVVLWLSGRDYYRDNPFEREAYAKQ